MSDEEILKVLMSADTPVLRTADVSEQLPISRRAVYNRLIDLEEQGLVSKMAVGRSPTFIWWASGGSDNE